MKVNYFLFACLVIAFIVIIGKFKLNNVEDTNNFFSTLASTRSRSSKYDRYFTENLQYENDQHVAVFLQIGNITLWKDLFQCTVRVAEATMQLNGTIDVYMSFLEGTNQSSINKILEVTKRVEGIRIVVEQIVANQGADVGQFLKQLEKMHAQSKSYDVILKMHTKSDDIWRQRGIESLCGTREQVHSALNLFRGSDVDMVSPLGTTFGPDTGLTQIFSHIVQKYNFNKPSSGPETAFDPSTIQKMQDLYHLLYPNSVPLTRKDLLLVAGTMFWVRPTALPLEGILKSSSKIYSGLTEGYRDNGGGEHILERLFATIIKANGRLIKELIPAPKVVALYFPQYHYVEENDKFWGSNFTEWTLLKPIAHDYILKPLSVKKDGLGYYDLMDKDGKTRNRQGQLATAAGVHAFCFYHYWFSGSSAPEHHKVMYKVTEEMLSSNKPNINFMLSWANEPWSRRWTGHASKRSDDVLLLSQEYGDQKEWTEHFIYLLQFFKHPRYVKIQGKPVFIIYRIGHVGRTLVPMLTLWRRLAKAAGLPGLHIVNTLGNIHKIDKTGNILKKADIQASFHFWPQLAGSGLVPITDTASTQDVRLNTGIQYWGAFTGFDRRPRDPNHKHPLIRTVRQFDRGLSCSFTMMSNPRTETDTNLFFVTAWNEWNEQAILEPSEQYGFQYLQTLHKNLVTIQGRTPSDTPKQIQCSTSILNPITNITSDAHVAVIIRAYSKQIHQLYSLVYSMIPMSTPQCSSYCVSFIVVPTELDSVEVLQNTVSGLSKLGIDIELVNPKKSWRKLFALAEAISLPCAENLSNEEFIAGLCDAFDKFDEPCRTRSMKELKLYGGLEDKKLKVCKYNNQVHYTLTDLALKQVVDTYSQTHDYVMVTNADNNYHKSFFQKTLVEKADMIATHFITDMDNVNARTVMTKFELAGVDLGAVLVSIRALKESGINFLNSIPHQIIKDSKLTDREKTVAMKRAYHDNDWWFFHKAIYELKFTSTVIPMTLFYHQ